MAGYRNKYFKTYFWSGLSLLLSFLSMFIVVPLTTSMPEAYGVYSLCISFRIFLQYADFGFINAGKKYAAEAFILGDVDQEKRYVGSSIFIYGAMVLILFLIALLGAAFPEYLIKNIDESPYYDMSHQLLFILAFSFPFSIIQKFCTLIYSVRIEEYRIQSFQILGSLIKIISVPLYFFNSRYDIVGYFLFSEVINVVVYVIILYYSKKIGYGIRNFFRCFRFDLKVFKEIMPLAFSGFVSTIGWIFYYELDILGISILLGANAVAIYAVGKQIQSFVRTLLSIVYSPYPTRINYFIGLKDYSGLKSFFSRLVEEFSFVSIPIIVIILYAKPLIKAWVGLDYMDSYLILQFSVSLFIINYVTSPGNAVLYGLNKIRDILLISLIKPVFFWGGVLLTYKYWGVNSVAILQLVSCIITEFYFCYLLKMYLKYTSKELYWNLLTKPLLLLSSFCILFWCCTKSYLDNVDKGHQDLLFVAVVMIACCTFAFLVDLCFNKSLRSELKGLLDTIKIKFYSL